MTTTTGAVRRALGAVTLLALCTAPAAAQDSAGVRPGAQLRIRVASTRDWRYGDFAGIATDTLFLRDRHANVVEPFRVSLLEEIDVRRRDDEKHARNELLGLVLGAATGLLATHLEVRYCENSHPHSDGPPCAIGYTAAPFAALIGAGAGVIVARVWPANRWQPVSSIIAAREP